MASAAAWDALQREGWGIDPQAVEELVEDVSTRLREQLLDIDLKKVGKGCLPDDINRSASSTLQGPCVLQVTSVQDISKPSNKIGGEGGSRLLRLKLTDGKISCKAVEYQQVDFISDRQLLPGTKVKLQGAAVKAGVVLLQPKCIQVLGGRVEALAAAWEVQQQYGGLKERPKAEGDEQERPPPFRSFTGKDARAAAGVARPPAPPASPAPPAKGPPPHSTDKTQQPPPPPGSRPGPPAPPPGLGSARGGRQPPGFQGQGRAGDRRDADGGSQRGAGGGRAGDGAEASTGPPKMVQAALASLTRHIAPGAPPGHQRASRPDSAPSRPAPREPPPAPPTTAASQPPATTTGRPPAGTAGSSGGTGRHGAEGDGQEGVQRNVPAPVQPLQQGGAQQAARQKLLGKMQESERGQEFGRGRGRGMRRGRRRYDDDEEEEGGSSTMTLEEYEAVRKAGPMTLGSGGGGGGSGGGSRHVDDAVARQMREDEELARQLQRQLEMEEMEAAGRQLGPRVGGGRGGRGLQADLAASLFSFDRGDEEEEYGGYGGRGRGGRGRGRGPGRGRGRGRGY